MDEKKIEVGAFSIASGVVSGPSEYMRAPDGFKARLAKIEAGACAVFNFARGSVEQCLLVSLQTVYAAWRGRQSLAAAVAS